MPEDRNALLQHYRQTWDALLSAIHGLRDELMTEAGPRWYGAATWLASAL